MLNKCDVISLGPASEFTKSCMEKVDWLDKVMWVVPLEMQSLPWVLWISDRSPCIYFFHDWKTIIPNIYLSCNHFLTRYEQSFKKLQEVPLTPPLLPNCLVLLWAKTCPHENSIGARSLLPTHTWGGIPPALIQLSFLHSTLPGCPRPLLSLHPQQLCPAWTLAWLEPGRGKHDSPAAAALVSVLWNGDMRVALPPHCDEMPARKGSTQPEVGGTRQSWTAAQKSRWQ